MTRSEVLKILPQKESDVADYAINFAKFVRATREASKLLEQDLLNSALLLHNVKAASIAFLAENDAKMGQAEQEAKAYHDGYRKGVEDMLQAFADNAVIQNEA